MKNTLARYNHPVFARQYDSGEQESHNGDIEFYTRLCKQSKGKVLELACGAGRVTIPLKKAGIDISGIDFAAEMVKLARKNARKMGVSIPFRVADAINFSGERFEIIIFPYNSLVLLADKQFPLFVKNLKKNLTEKGIFAFDINIPNRNAKKIPLIVKTDWSEPLLIPELGVSIRRKIVHRFSFDRKKKTSTYFWEITNKNGEKTIEKNTMTFLLYPLSWYIKQFTKCGFVLKRKKILKKRGAATDHVFVVLQLKTI